MQPQLYEFGQNPTVGNRNTNPSLQLDSASKSSALSQLRTSQHAKKHSVAQICIVCSVTERRSLVSFCMHVKSRLTRCVESFLQSSRITSIMLI